MRSKYIEDDRIKVVLAALMPANALACEMSLETGMRIGDVVKTKTADIEKQTFTYKEEKTGKTRRVRISKDLRFRILRQAGDIYAFESRCHTTKHRTRQAVWKDLKRAEKLFRLKGLSPHSMRKDYAVRQYHRTKDISKVQELLKHSSEAVTMIYALADRME